NRGTLIAALIGSLPALKNFSVGEKLQQVDELRIFLEQLPPAPWYPQTGPQSLAFVCEAQELFMGGSAGGGKSDLLFGLSKTAHINSTIIRPESTQLTGFKQRVQETMSPGDRW